MCTYYYRKMIFELAIDCDFTYELLKCSLPADTIDVDHKVCTQKDIHTYKKDYKMQIIKCSPWGVEIRPTPVLKKKWLSTKTKESRSTPPMRTHPTGLNTLQEEEGTVICLH